MSMLVRAFPLRAPLKDVEAFAATLRTERKTEAAAFYRKFGVSHESWHLQETPAGAWIIGVTVVDDPVSAAPKYAASAEAFDAWFKDQVLRFSGVDPTQQPLGPPTTQVFAWSDDERQDARACQST